jgi:hypothetical protein
MNPVHVTILLAAFSADSCDLNTSSDRTQSEQQEHILLEGTNAVGMPAIHNFRERRLLKDILEMRDQNGLTTFTYLFSEVSGKLTFFCDSIGYGIPYATQFTNPQKLEYRSSNGYYPLPQADPNGLFSPAAADGTWVMCKNPGGPETRPVYVEPKIIVSPFRIPNV